MKKFFMLVSLLVSWSAFGGDKLAPGTPMTLFNLLPGNIYKFDFAGYADDSVYTVSFPEFAGEFNLPPPITSFGAYGVDISVHEVEDSNFEFCKKSRSIQGMRQVDGFDVCYRYEPRFSYSNKRDAYKEHLTTSFWILMYVEAKIDKNTILGINYIIKIGDVSKDKITYDATGEVPLFLPDHGVIPNKFRRAFAKDAMIELLNYFGIEKIR